MKLRFLVLCLTLFPVFLPAQPAPEAGKPNDFKRAVREAAAGLAEMRDKTARR